MAKKSDPAAVDPSRSVRDVFCPKGRKRGLIVRIQVDYSSAGNLLRYSLSLIDLSSPWDNGGTVGYTDGRQPPPPCLLPDPHHHRLEFVQRRSSGCDHGCRITRGGKLKPSKVMRF